MHQYIETVRNEIEAAAGQESYLSSALFLKIYKDLDYEDGGDRKLNNKEEYEMTQHKAMNSISSSKEFEIKDEILAWQVAILRDISRSFYDWWVDYKEEKFRAQDYFQDGEACLAVEASCEKLKAIPTEVYTTIIEAEILLKNLCTSCNTTIIEIDKFWQFKYHNTFKAQINDFMRKRISNESKNTIIYKSISSLNSLSERCLKYANKLAGADHLLWMTPHSMLESMVNTLYGFLNFEYVQDMDLALSKWLKTIFPERLESGQPNPIYHSPLHHKIIGNLSQATNCLVQYTVNKIDTFSKIIDPLCRVFNASEVAKKFDCLEI